jgi:hypothetical protein
MDIKNAVVDTLDPRPIKKATLYAFGTMLEGVAIGLLLTVLLPQMNTVTRCVIAAACFLVGAVLTVSAYSALKRRYRIEEKEA